MKNQKQSYIYAIIAVILWSTVATAFKIALHELDFLQLLFVASAVSIFILGTVLLFQKKLVQLKSYSRKEYLNSALLGFLNPFLYYVILFKAYAILPAQEAQPLNYTWPIMLVLLSVPLLKQKINLRGFIAILISFFGVFVISTKGDVLGFGFSNLNGAILALSTAVLWALFWIFNTKDRRDDVVKLFLNFAFGFVYITITVLVFSEISIPNLNALIAGSYVGLFEMGITFLIWSMALKLSQTTAKVSRLIYLVPFLSLISLYFVVGEEIRMSTIMGLVFIVIGIVLGQSKKRTASNLG